MSARDEMCDRIGEKMADGETLSDGERGHVEGCATCGATKRTAERVRDALASRRPVGPSVGFEARVTAHAAERMHSRRRTFAIVSGVAAVGAAAVIFVVLTRGDDRQQGDRNRDPQPATATSPTATEEKPRIDLELAEALYDVSDVDFALRDGARWGWIEEPIAETSLFAPDLREMKGGPR